MVQNQITSDSKKKGLVSTVFGQSKSQLEQNAVYQIGDRMATLLKNPSMKQYNGGFPFPKPDTFGICNNFKSAEFYIDD